MKHGRWLKPLSSAAAIVMAFLIAGFVVFLSGEDPGTAYRALFRGAFGSLTGLKNTVRYSIPIIMLGFSFAICNDCGFFNIGQEGQMYAAAIAAAGAALIGAGLPRGLQLLLIIAAAVIAGGILCLIPAVLKFVFGVNEVIVSMLLNYIMVLLTNYLLLNSSIGITGRTTPSSIEFEPRIEAWVLAGLSALIMLAYALFMKNTVPGYRLRMTGRNADFAKANGIRVRKIILSACFLGGAFSALSAVGEILGIYHRVYDGFAENLGFYGMTAALIGSQSTSGLIFGGIILGALQSGSVSLTVMTDVSSDMVLVVQGFVMLFATVNILRILGKRGKHYGLSSTS